MIAEALTLVCDCVSERLTDPLSLFAVNEESI